MKNNRNKVISNWLSQHGDPAIDKMVKHNLAIATKVACILEEKGLTKKKFAEIMGKSPSEVTKWLSGTHNFTIKSISKMEQALGTDIIHVEKEFKYVYLGSIKGTMKKEKEEYEKTILAYEAS